MTTVIEIHTPVGLVHLSHPRLDEMPPDAVERLRALIQADTDRGPCLNLWHPNCSVGCMPAHPKTPAASSITGPRRDGSPAGPGVVGAGQSGTNPSRPASPPAGREVKNAAASTPVAADLEVSESGRRPNSVPVGARTEGARAGLVSGAVSGAAT